MFCDTVSILFHSTVTTYTELSISDPILFNRTVFLKLDFK